MARTPAEEYASAIAEMGRSELIALLRTADCAFRLDFTDEFLDSLSLERLRHITLAAKLHSHSAQARR